MIFRYAAIFQYFDYRRLIRLPADAEKRRLSDYAPDAAAADTAW